MKPAIHYGRFYRVETTAGTEIVPLEVSGGGKTAAELRVFLEGRPLDPKAEPEVEEGWLGRMSAPGYLDCTAWGAYDTEAEAEAALAEMYGDEEE